LSEDNFSGFDRRDEFDDFMSWYTGCEYSELVFIAQREPSKQPSDCLAVLIFQRIRGAVDDTLPKAIREIPPLFLDGFSK
jgi:hypothetical protein